MDAAEVRQWLLTQYGIRVEPEMSEYVLRQLQQAGKALGGASFPVMGGDARTGFPVRQMISAGAFTADAGLFEPLS
jgi:hypothetical protein